MMTTLSVSGARLYDQLRRQVHNPAILAAIRCLPREKFLDPSMLPYAGDDAALPIGYDQTTSAPLVIARMLDMMLGRKKPPLKILEIGSGCGYQTALLAEMGCSVIGIERIQPLADAARRRLAEMGYNTATIMHRDGFAGDAENAPFDGIIVCAECAMIPQQLVSQLAPAARLVLPLRQMQKDGVCLTAVNNSGEVVSVREQVRFVQMRKGVE